MLSVTNSLVYLATGISLDIKKRMLNRRNVNSVYLSQVMILKAWMKLSLSARRYILRYLYQQAEKLSTNNSLIYMELMVVSSLIYGNRDRGCWISYCQLGGYQETKIELQLDNDDYLYRRISSSRDEDGEIYSYKLSKSR